MHNVELTGAAALWRSVQRPEGARLSAGLEEMSMINEWTSALGFKREHRDGLKPRIRFVVHHQRRIWVLSCLPETDSQGFELPETSKPFRPFELFVLGCGVLWCDVVTKLQRATNGLRAKLCR